MQICIQRSDYFGAQTILLSLRRSQLRCLDCPAPNLVRIPRYATLQRINEFYVRILIKIFIVKRKLSSLERSSIRRSDLFWDFTQQPLLGPWKRNRQVVSKRQWGINILRRVQSKKNVHLISIAVEVCNHTF